MKKVTITELKKEITKLKTTNKELEERNNRMWELNRKYERELEELKEIRKQLEIETKENNERFGVIRGMQTVLDKIILDTNITAKNLSEREIYEQVERNNRGW